ncbi:MAG: type II toxin-antitoxin system HicA family toxin [Acidobacteria bacterium]|nr:type II toxin-antitoxin system HicA family toxin [Acidobacteriota bacterium]
MAQRTKLFEKIKNNPNNVTFAQIERLLLREGFSLDRITGSHHVFTRENVTFVIPKHGKQVKSVYVKRVIETLEEETE